MVVEDLQMLVTKSKAGPVQLAKCHLDVIQILKEKLSNAPIFPYPNPECTFLIDCDASETAIGCELSQVVDGKECVISYGSFSLTPAQRKYCTTHKELLAVVRFTRQFRHYLLGHQFVCRTDHNSLTWLMSFKNIEGQLARWMEELAQFDMVVVHRAGNYMSMLTRYREFLRPGVIVLIIVLVFHCQICLVIVDWILVSFVLGRRQGGHVLKMKWTMWFLCLYVAYRLTFLLEVQIIGCLDTPKGI